MKKLLPLYFLLACVISVPAAATEVKELAKTGQSWNGAALPEYSAGTPEITVLHISIDPGAKLPLHWHTVINAGYLVSGELTVFTEKGKKLQMKAGDAIVEVVGTKHYGVNNGKEPAVIVVFYAGIKDEPITIKVGDEKMPTPLTEKANGTAVPMKVGEDATIKLAANPTTGYLWQVAEQDKKSVAITSGNYLPTKVKPGVKGSGGQVQFTIKALKPGKSKLKLQYVRPWEKEKKPAKTFEVEIVAE